jgi:hypothetical protein
VSARTQRHTAGVLFLALALLIAGCGPKGSGKGAGNAGKDDTRTGDQGEPTPPKTLFSAHQIASLFSHPGPLGVNDATLGPEWEGKGKVVWAVSYASPDETFAPVTVILFEGRYLGQTISTYEKDLLQRSGGYKDLEYKNGRAGWAMRAGGEGDAIETALIPSPRGRFHLLVLVEVSSSGPTEAPDTAAYRALLMDYTVKLLESVALGLDEAWVKPPSKPTRQRR